MWRYQEIFDILCLDNRFSVYLVFSPFVTYSKDENKFFLTKIRERFDKLNVPLFDASNKENAKKLVEKLDPDIIFYPQQYDNLFYNSWDFLNFRDRLLCYVPYGLHTLYAKWIYQTVFTTIGWRMYYANTIHKSNARRLSYDFGMNVRVVGEPHADLYRDKEVSDPWPDNRKKRVIYAPHFQIFPNDMLYRPSFLWTGTFMLDLATRYSDRLQIAFKPHPRLYSELCKHPGWGEAKAKEYYFKWETMSNTQLEKGDFIDLFKTSDALIHDCGSFTAEYQFTKKPCLFLTKDEESVKKDLCPFGKKCFDNHYIGSKCDDIVNFIENVVLKGNDPKLKQRERFYNDYLLPPNNKSTAENIYDDLGNSLFRN